MSLARGSRSARGRFAAGFKGDTSRDTPGRRKDRRFVKATRGPKGPIRTIVDKRPKIIRKISKGKSTVTKITRGRAGTITQTRTTERTTRSGRGGVGGQRVTVASSLSPLRQVIPPTRISSRPKPKPISVDRFIAFTQKKTIDRTRNPTFSPISQNIVSGKIGSVFFGGRTRDRRIQQTNRRIQALDTRIASLGPGGIFGIGSPNRNERIPRRLGEGEFVFSPGAEGSFTRREGLSI